MQIVTAKEFRSSQSKVLRTVKTGEQVILTSREGNFKIVPIAHDDALTARICEALKEVKMTLEGQLPVKSARAFLDEL